jgi:hypothetical protein
MDAHETVEFAALVTVCGSSAIVGDSPLWLDGLVRDYWTASMERMDRWDRALAACRPNGESESSGRERARLVPVLQELLAGEVLTRVWTAVVAAFDRRHGAGDSEPIVRNVCARHQPFCARVQRCLAAGLATEDAHPTATTAAIAQCCRQAQRWTDLLIGRLAIASPDAAEFAFAADRARDFAADLQQLERTGTNGIAWSITLGSLRSTFRRTAVGPLPNPGLNGRIAATILSGFDPVSSVATGTFESLCIARLACTTTDAAGMIDDLLRLHL